MKRVLIFLSILIISCSESFQIVNVAKFNKEINGRTDINDIEELIKIYYAYSDENTSKIKIQSKEIGRGLVEATLIHDFKDDDSVKAIKIIMTAKLKKNKWVVYEIKKNWKCHDGRGHTNWGKEWCS